jgi:hypothetical protein
MTKSKPSSRARRWLAGFGVLGLLGAIGLIPVASVAAAEPNADMVIVWHRYAVNALSNPLPTAIPTPPDPGASLTPPPASIHLGIVQGAVYDAVNAIDGGHQPYLSGLSAPATASKAAAAATAAYDVLIGLRKPAPVATDPPVPVLPAVVLANLLGHYNDSLAAITDPGEADGITVGHAAAAAMLANRVGDGRWVPFSFTSRDGLGQWKAEPPNGSDPFAWVSNVRPFTLTGTDQFRTEGPNDLTSAAYAADYNEVKTMGSLTDSGRTVEQTLEARFFAFNPLIMINRSFDTVAADHGLSLAEGARLFGMTSMASADALIDCWDNKDYWSFWRPTTAIHDTRDDGNPATEPQAGWTPLIATGTPPYPDEPSGYNCFSGAMMHSASSFFGTDKVSYTLASNITGTTRSYDRLSFLLRDTIDARVWLGIHFRAADVNGAWIGKKVAQWEAKHFFQAAN